MCDFGRHRERYRNTQLFHCVNNILAEEQRLGCVQAIRSSQDDSEIYHAIVDNAELVFGWL
jgi:hypothetical protein